MATDPNPKKSSRSFFKNNPFFSVADKEEETIPAQPVTPNPGVNPAVFNIGGATTLPQSEFPMPPPIVAVGAEVEEQYLNHFMDFLEKNNIPGLDYLEFANLLHKQYEKFGNTLTEAQLFEMAFMSFETQGITKAKLIETANTYLNLLSQHKQEFDGYLKNDGAATVQAKTVENDKLTKANTAASQKIAELQGQIVQLQSGINTNNQVIQTNIGIIQGESQKLQAKQIKFEGAYKVVLEKINGDIQKIQTLLK